MSCRLICFQGDHPIGHVGGAPTHEALVFSELVLDGLEAVDKIGHLTRNLFPGLFGNNFPLIRLSLHVAKLLLIGLPATLKFIELDLEFGF